MTFILEMKKLIIIDWKYFTDAIVFFWQGAHETQVQKYASPSKDFFGRFKIFAVVPNEDVTAKC